MKISWFSSWVWLPESTLNNSGNLVSNNPFYLLCVFFGGVSTQVWEDPLPDLDNISLVFCTGGSCLGAVHSMSRAMCINSIHYCTLSLRHDPNAGCVGKYIVHWTDGLWQSVYPAPWIQRVKPVLCLAHLDYGFHNVTALTWTSQCWGRRGHKCTILHLLFMDIYGNGWIPIEPCFWEEHPARPSILAWKLGIPVWTDA